MNKYFKGARFRLQGLVFIALALLLILSGSVIAPLTQTSAADPPGPQEIISLRTQTSKTYDLGNNRYASDTSIGAIHYQDSEGNWQDINTNYSETDSGNYTAKFTKIPYVLRMGNDGTRRIYPDRNDLSYWIDIGKPFASMGSPVKNGGYWVWDYPNATMKIRVANSAVKLDFILKNQTAPKSITFPFSVEGITRQDRFLYHDGKVVAELRLPIATGSNLDAEGFPVEKECQVTWATGSVTISLDTTGLTYPITIDPTLEVQVGASADDGFELETVDTPNITATYVSVASGTTASDRRQGGLRFTSANYPVQGTTIDVAYFKGYIHDASYDNANFNIHCEELAAPAAFNITDGNITGRDKTENSTSWIATDIAAGGLGWYNSPSICGVNSPIQEVFDAFSPTAIVIICKPNTDAAKQLRIRSWDDTTNPTNTWGAILHLEWEEGGVSVPTVVTNAASSIEATTATLSGNITDTGGENCTDRGFEWDTDSGAPYSNNWTESGDYGICNFTHGITSLPEGTTIYCRAIALNSAGWGVGSEDTLLTKPAAPTSVAATENSADNVTITWTKATGATDYQVYRDGSALGWAGDVATFTDNGSSAPTIAAGNTVASDGTFAAYVALSISGESTSNGATHTYKVRAKNATGESADSSTDAGYRLVGALSYQWQRSAADSDTDYSNIGGATTENYNDTGAPENGDGRYYQCVLNASGASENTTVSNRGYRDTVTAPVVAVGVASGITDNDATLNATITDDGGVSCNVTWYWDTTDYGETESWVYSVNQTDKTTGAISYTITDNLTEETLYYFIVKGINEAGQDWSASANFTTLEAGYLVEAPTGFTLTAILDNQINATWDNVTGANSYLLLVSIVDYPSSPTGDDHIAYSGNFTSCNLTGYVLPLTTYYFSLWAKSNPYSEEYATASIGGEGMAAISSELANFVTTLGEFNTILELISLTVLSLVVLILASWRKEIVLYIIAGLVACFTAFGWVETYPMASLMFFCLGLYQFSTAVILAVSGGRATGIQAIKNVTNKVREWFNA